MARLSSSSRLSTSPPRDARLFAEVKRRLARVSPRSRGLYEWQVVACPRHPAPHSRSGYLGSLAVEIRICCSSYRVPATADSGMASSMRLISSGVSVTCSAPSDSASCSRVRAPIRGDRGTLCEDPRDRQLRGRGAFVRCQLLQRLNYALIALAVVTRKAWQIRPKIALCRRFRIH